MTLPKTAFSLAIGTIMLTAYAGVPAYASTKAPQENVKEVNIAGYDLTNLGDAQEVLEKIQAASNKVCSTPNTLVSRDAYKAKQICKSKAVREAVEALNSPTLNAAMKSGE